jgi:hypothetical protein
MKENLKQTPDKTLMCEKRVADALRENLRKRKRQLQMRGINNNKAEGKE